MNDPLSQTDTQACAARTFFQIAFLKDSKFCNALYRCSCNYDYSSQGKLSIQGEFCLMLPFATSLPKLVPPLELPRKFVSIMFSASSSAPGTKHGIFKIHL